jgi:hypothetical protein
VSQKKKEVSESPASRDLSGFGEAVVKLTDKETGQVVAFIGMQQGEEKVHIPNPLTPDQLEAVHDLVQRKKFNKHISNERFDKAQAFADRKFS